MTTDRTMPRDALARALGLPEAAIDALMGGAQLDRIPLQELERALQAVLARLQQVDAQLAAPAAPAPVTPAVPAAPEEPGPEEAELRRAPRYIPRRHIVGIFEKVKFSILQISSTGLRIRHEASVLPGETGRLTFAIGQPPQSFPMTARVIWTSIVSRGQGPSVCISGVRAVENADRLARAVEMLRQKGELDADRSTRGKGAAKSPAALRGVSDEEIASIVRVVRRLANEPVEANRWLARARYAIADEQIRNAIQQYTRDRDQILAVWEALERKIDLAKVAAVVAWMRSARTAAV